MLNEFEAAIYVKRLETKWYGAPFAILSVKPSREMADSDEIAFDVVTTQNSWTVWIEYANGEIYGEC